MYAYTWVYLLILLVLFLKGYLAELCNCTANHVLLSVCCLICEFTVTKRLKLTSGGFY